MGKRIDWSKAEQEYVTGKLSLKDLAKKYGVHHRTFKTKSVDGDWGAKREAYRVETGYVEVKVTRVIEKKIDKALKAVTPVVEEKVEAAIEEVTPYVEQVVEIAQPTPEYIEQHRQAAIAAAVKVGTTRSYLNKLPRRMRDAYEESMGDPNRFSASADVSLVDARIADLIARVDTGESTKLWRHLQAQGLDVKGKWSKYNVVKASGNANAMAQAMGDFVQAISMLLDMIKDGYEDSCAWEDVRNWQDHRRRLVESEMKRIKSAQEYVVTGDLVALLRGFRDALYKRVDELPLSEGDRNDFMKGVADDYRELAKQVASPN